MTSDAMKVVDGKLGHGKPMKPKEETKPAGKMKKMIHLHIRPTDNEGYVVDHEEMGQEPNKRTTHAFEKIDGMLDHVKSSYGKEGSEWENKRSDKEAQPEGKPMAGGPETKD